ncbi:MAG: AbrB/MazE/SpoVT family DNA-binding domain-containing protein [Nanoarchaeota archaeon]
MVELRVKLGLKGQVVIPKIFRDHYKMFPNQEVIITENEFGLTVKKPQSNVSEYFKEQASKVSKKGSHYNKKEFYEQYEKRLKRAGL